MSPRTLQIPYNLLMNDIPADRRRRFLPICGTIAALSGLVVLPVSAQVQAPDLRIQAPDHRIVAPDHRNSAPDHRIAPPDHRVSPPDRRIQAPDYRIGLPDTRIEAPDYRIVPPTVQPFGVPVGPGAGQANGGLGGLPPPAGAIVPRRADPLTVATSKDSESDARFERARALVESGVRLENGEGVVRDLGKAMQLYCEAAKSGLPEAYVQLGWLFANGRGVQRSESVAYTMFRKAAVMGSELGERLTDLFAGQPMRMPPCLGGEALPEDLPPPAKTVVLAQTPSVEAPAQFSNGAPSIERRKVVEMVVRQARQLKLDPRLVLALIGTESGFDPLARSVKNAQGLMQLIPDTAERFAVKDILDPAENLRGGMTYLRWLLAYYRGDVWLAVAAYNAGEGAVDRFRGIPPYAETMAYVQRIRNQYPLDRHPFEPGTAPSSSIFGGKRLGPTTLLGRGNPG